MAICLINVNTIENIISSRDTVIIDSVPYIGWTYNTEVSSIAPILWYWDYRNYGRLVDFFCDTIDFNKNIRPNVIREIYEFGVEYVTDTLNTYDFDFFLSPPGTPANAYYFSWIKDEIDNGRPCQWQVYNYYWAGDFINHALVAVGYVIASSDTFIAVNTTWSPGIEYWPLWTYHSGFYSYDRVFRIIPGGANPDNIFITYPTDSGLVLQAGDTIDITWDSYGTDINYVSIWLASSYDTTEWLLIEQNAPNTGSYEWIAPNDSLRARINLQGYTMTHQLEAADGSYYGFTILPTGIEEEKNALGIEDQVYCSNIFSGPLLLPEGKNCKVFDITGRVVAPEKIKPGIYFIEIDGRITQKVVKVR